MKQKFNYLRPLHPKQEIITRVVVIRIRPEKDLVNLSTIGQSSQGDVFVEGEALVHVQDLEKSNKKT